MSKNIKRIVLLVVLFSVSFANAKDISILFIGNSYTYLPSQGTPEDPGLPKIINKIVQSIDANLNIKYAFNTQGGYTFEKHFNDQRSQTLLRSSYNHIILQGNSIESLELPPEWIQNGIGVQSFSVFLPRLLAIATARSSEVTIFVNWGWNFKNSNLQPGAKGLLFPPGSAKAGQPWCGRNKFEFQNMIDEGYKRISAGFRVSLSRVGDAWLSLQQAGIVGEDALYLQGDWSHPSILGAFVEGLVITRDVLKLDILRSNYQPAEVDPKLAKMIRYFLARNPAAR